jgi:hypothetical protein
MDYTSLGPNQEITMSLTDMTSNRIFVIKGFPTEATGEVFLASHFCTVGVGGVPTRSRCRGCNRLPFLHNPFLGILVSVDRANVLNEVSLEKYKHICIKIPDHIILNVFSK